MSEKDNGGPAFPTPKLEGEQGDYWTGCTDGVTLRDYFAAKALASIIVIDDHENVADQSACAYRYADYMLEARKK